MRVVYIGTKDQNRTPCMAQLPHHHHPCSCSWVFRSPDVWYHWSESAVQWQLPLVFEKQCQSVLRIPSKNRLLDLSWLLPFPSRVFDQHLPGCDVQRRHVIPPLTFDGLCITAVIHITCISVSHVDLFLPSFRGHILAFLVLFSYYTLSVSLRTCHSRSASVNKRGSLSIQPFTYFVRQSTLRRVRSQLIPDSERKALAYG
ncbi:hypothetical protein BDW67DRAFT_163275 [Aspergillus spinulosporus]